MLPHVGGDCLATHPRDTMREPSTTSFSDFVRWRSAPSTFEEFPALRPESVVGLGRTRAREMLRQPMQMRWSFPCPSPKPQPHPHCPPARIRRKRCWKEQRKRCGRRLRTMTAAAAVTSSRTPRACEFGKRGMVRDRRQEMNELCEREGSSLTRHSPTTDAGRLKRFGTCCVLSSELSSPTKSTWR